MIYRSDLIDHFDWLAGSELFDELVDEALVAIAITAHGHGKDMVQSGGAWWIAADFCRYHRLEPFVERARRDRALWHDEDEDESDLSDSLDADDTADRN